MLNLVLKLILAHIIGDFILQPTKWIDGRNTKTFKSKHLYYHVGVHFLATLLLLIDQLKTAWPGIIIIILCHFLIDIIKIYLEKTNTIKNIYLFVIDQLLHLLVISFVVNLYFPFEIKYALLLSNKSLIILIAVLITTYIVPFLLKLFFERWSNSLISENAKTNEENLKTESLKDAGKFIGILERILIIIFINFNFLEGIGYLLAAKSIFRFGDLTHSKEKKLTEYILIGTFMSFAIAVIIGFALKIVLNRI